MDGFLESLAEQYFVIRYLDSGVFLKDGTHKFESFLHGKQQFLIIPIAAGHKPNLVNALHLGQVVDQLEMSEMRWVKGSSIDGDISDHDIDLIIILALSRLFFVSMGTCKD